MPSVTTRGTTIEVIVPLRQHLGGSCTICMQEYCSSGTCRSAQTHLSCCEQSVCCGCIAKLSKRCTCNGECECVIVICPFCREISGVGALDILLGLRNPCEECGGVSEPEGGQAREVATSHRHRRS